MSLTSAFNRAQNILSNAGIQLGIITRNIDNLSNRDYVRQDVVTKTMVDGLPVVVKERAQNVNMFRKLLESSSSEVGSKRLMEGLNNIRMLLGGGEYQNSPSGYMAQLQKNLQTYAVNTSKSTVAEMVVGAADDVVGNLRDISNGVQKLRAETDEEINLDVSKLNRLLSEFTVANNRVKAATALGDGVSEFFDRRDSLLKQISEIIGISTVTRDNNDLIIYTETGITLFETVPRKVDFEKTILYDASVKGKYVYINGVRISAPVEVNTVPIGKVEALLEIRDKVAVIFQNQLDEIARGLITTFSERAPQPNRSRDVPGLFTADGIKLPLNGLSKGLAASIRINPQYKANPPLIRDSGSAGDSYKWNEKEFEGYSSLVNYYSSAMDDKNKIQFDATSKIGASVGLLDYGRRSIGWLEQCRSDCDRSVIKTSTMSRHISEIYHNNTGVNLQEELNLLIQANKSYNVSSRLIFVINEMIETLLKGVR